MSGFLPLLSTVTAGDVATAVRAELATELARIDAAISTRLATAGYTAPDNAGIAVIKAKTDNIPASPAAAGEYTAAIAAIPAQTVTAMDTNSIGLAMIPDIPTLAEIVAATIPVNVQAVNGITITGAGIEDTDEWRPA
jgi:hypothetical protein